MNLQTAKDVAWGLATSLSPDVSSLSGEMQFHGPAPIERADGITGFQEIVLEPLRRSMPTATKRPYLFLGGIYQDAIWVAATGNIVGEMEQPWLGIPIGPGERKLRFGEFYRIEHGRVAEIRCLFDIPGLAAQAGIELLPKFDGASQIPDGPANGIAVVRDSRESSETELTRRLVTDMITGGCNRLVGSDLSSQQLDQYWHEDMAWHGPWGVGSSYGMDEYYRFAQGPSVRSFPGRKGSWPKLAFPVEGEVAAFTGWPGLIGEFTGEPFRGIQPTNGPIGQTVMDFYLRRQDRLLENWVLIDLIKFAADCGVDLLAKLPCGTS